MAVNENLYSWMLKTYGMGAAEWYRNNPSAKPGANPYLPKGAYVPLAKGGQQTGPRGETLASVSPDIVEASVIEPAKQETEDEQFERFFNQANQQYQEAAKQKPQWSTDLSWSPSKADSRLIYDPNYGQYGGYFTDIEIRKPSSLLYNQVDKLVSPIRNQTYSGDYSDWREWYAQKQNEATEVFNREYTQKLEGLDNKDLGDYQREGVEGREGLNRYLAQLQQLGITPGRTTGSYQTFVSAATENDPDVQYYGLGNVGRADYRTNRANEAIIKNIEMFWY